MKRSILALALAGSAFALAAPASADPVCVGRFTGRGLVCVDPDTILRG